ncbi:dienelactone hydrolase family protein [Marinobacter bohaiensis]|uniref:dienelactone hydrolase family protein n=1 Tax=Marinobacter bohaiensis TaxID=2201898 RepID=UPI000DABD63F|nr:dienelactone hydrolase family protein [Marinobacter bohaiensis]
MTHVETRDVEYVQDDTRMLGYFCSPRDAAPGSCPGVLVVHGAEGMTKHVMASAERLAALGYAALAVDLWGGRKRLNGPAEFDDMIGLFAEDRTLWMGRMEAARETLRAQSSTHPGKLGGLGYCFGGSSVLEFVRSGGELQGVVSFHGGINLVHDDWSDACGEARALICTGADDPMANADDLARVQEAMTQAGLGWEVNLYGHTRHAFTEADGPGTPPFAAYSATADCRSWHAMTGFFEDVFGQ